jgi:hypothetical protein
LGLGKIKEADLRKILASFRLIVSGNIGVKEIERLI